MTNPRLSKSISLSALAFGALALSPITAGASQEWAETFGGASTERAEQIVNAPGGDFIVAGNNFSVDSAGDIWFARIGSGGAVIWENTIGAKGSDTMTAMVATADGGAIFCGRTESVGFGGWIVKLSAAGTVDWQRAYGGTVNFTDIDVAPGGYYVVGTVEQDKNYKDACVLHIDSTGALVWQKRFAGTQEDVGGCLATASDGLLVSIQTNSSLPAVPGTPKIGSVPFTRPWVVKLDANGNSMWQRVYNYSSGDVWSDVAALSNGDFAFTGEIASAAFFQGDAWLTRIDGSGNILWDREIGDNFGALGHDFGASVIETDAGNLVVAGGTGTAGAGSNDMWLISYDAAGTLLWDRVLGGTGFDGAGDLVEASNGDLVIAGFAQHLASPTVDSFVVRADSVGQMSASCALVGSTQPQTWSATIDVKMPDVVPTNLLLGDKFTLGSPKPQASAAFYCLPQAGSAVFGCGTNPVGSLTVSPAPIPGSVITFGVDNPLGTQTIGSIPLVALSTTRAIPGASCGLMLPGYGMSAPGAIGELLISWPAAIMLFGPAWTGVPSSIALPLPVDPAMVGVTVFAQGAIVDPFGPITIGLTEGLELTFGI